MILKTTRFNNSDPYSSALNLIGPRAMDVLAELSYVSMTPDHFPSMFCKV